MDTAQFEQFMQMLSASAPQRPDSRPTYKVTWTNLSALSTAEPADLDKWFMEFETRLRSTPVPESKWVEKFVECPTVPEHLKSRVREEHATPAPSAELTYGALRTKLLEEFGPIEPVAYYKRRLHHVKGATASEVKEQLSTLLELHNRAAEDHEEGKLQPRSLCYCFIDALPPALGQHLEANYALAANTAQPLEQLFKMARPGKPRRVPPSSSPLPRFRLRLKAAGSDLGLLGRLRTRWPPPLLS